MGWLIVGFYYSAHVVDSISPLPIVHQRETWDEKPPDKWISPDLATTRVASPPSSLSVAFLRNGLRLGFGQVCMRVVLTSGFKLRMPWLSLPFCLLESSSNFGRHLPVTATWVPQVMYHMSQKQGKWQPRHTGDSVKRELRAPHDRRTIPWSRFESRSLSLYLSYFCEEKKDRPAYIRPC